MVVGQRYYLVYPKIQSFNAYTCDLFFEVRDLEYTSFADDTTQYSCLPEMIPVLEKVEKRIQNMFDWFSENFLKANADKCYLIASFKVPVFNIRY